MLKYTVCHKKGFLMNSRTELSMNIPAEHQKNIFGDLDEHIKSIERTLNVDIIVRDDSVKVQGPALNSARARKLLAQLLVKSERGETVTTQNVNYALSLFMDDMGDRLDSLDDDIIIHTMAGRPIKAKTLGQKAYVDSIRNKMITFGVGPAGTGKTYMAMAMAVRAFRKDEVSRIILTRPAIEAGEKLGFLPGDLQSKIDPYLRPLYAFIILDEAQNTTPAQMKMFLTRIGFGTKVVITGDRTQKDLPRDQESGLDVSMKVLKKIDEIGFCELTSKDVVRHPLVQKIVQAYEVYEEKNKKSRPRETGARYQVKRRRI